MPNAIRQHKKSLLTATALSLMAIGIVYYAAGSDAAEGEAAAAAAMAAIPVKVQTIAPESVRLWSTFSGRLRPVDAAEIRPEVSGRITDLRFEDGQQVKAGNVLLVIDPRPYEAAAAMAEAKLATAQSNAKFARMEKQRAEKMLESQAIAQRLYDERVNAERVAEAAIKAAQAELKQAKLDLEHAYVRAPISGRVSRAEITVGNLVQAGQNAPLLTSVVANDEIYADFEVDEQTYLRTIRAHANGREQEREIPVELTVGGDTEHSYKGTIHSFDNHIDPATGTIRARAKFTNDDGALVPGMFASVSLAGGSDSTALVIPERALGYDQSKKFVYIVDEANKVGYREVEMGRVVDNGRRVVLAGLKAGDRVIVSGTQHVRPEALVAPTEVETAQQNQTQEDQKENKQALAAR